MDTNDMDYEGEVIKLDKVRHIKYTIKGLKLISKAFGSVNEAMLKIEKLNINFDIETLDDICIFAHAGLIHEDPDLTLDEVENLLEFGTVIRIMKLLLVAISHSMPESKEVSDATPGESQSTSTELSITRGSNGTSRKKKLTA